MARSITADGLTCTRMFAEPVSDRRQPPDAAWTPTLHQRRVLGWVVAYGYAAAAAALGISPHTVEKTLIRMRHAAGVDTTLQLVALCASRRWIVRPYKPRRTRAAGRMAPGRRTEKRT